MTDFAFRVLGARVERYAAVPTLMFRLRVEEKSGEPVDAIALQCQIRIEPQRRRYEPGEEEKLKDLFGETPRWGDTLKPFLWTHVTVMIPRLAGAAEIELPVPCSYDLEVAAGKYFHALAGGEIPLLFLFSGMVFGGNGDFRVSRVPWENEASFRLPVATWRELMEIYFPNGGWLRLSRETLDRLLEFKARRALPTWDSAIEALLQETGEPPGEPLG